MQLRIIHKAIMVSLIIAFAFSLPAGTAIAASDYRYIYDELNRLKEVQYPDGTVIQYDYDKLGNITHKLTNSNTYKLTVQKAGSGSGTVVSYPEGMNCTASACISKFPHGATVTLSSLPTPGSALTSWSGGGCNVSGSFVTSNCTVTLTGDTTVTATYGQIFDLYLTEVGNPAINAATNTITLHNTVAASPVQSAEAFHVYYYLSTDRNITMSDKYVGWRPLSGLAAGASDTADTVLIIPADLAPGAYYAGAIANPVSEVYELNVANNGMASQLSTIYVPDLVMTAVSGPTSVNAEPTITVSSTVKNQGQSVAGGFDVRFYLSLDDTITTSDIYLGSRAVGGLNVGAESTANATVAVPASVGTGVYYIGAIADAEGVVAESNEANDTLAGNQIMVYHGSPELVMTAIAGPVAAYPGKVIPVTNTVQNIGSGPAAGYGFYVYLYLSADNAITLDDIYLGGRFISQLDAASDDTFTNLVTIPLKVPPGTYYLGAIADAQGNVPESNETNNALAGSQLILSLTGNHLIEAGASHTLALKTDGSLWAWGNNYRGQLGFGDNPVVYYTDVPTQIGSSTNWSADAGGQFHTIALKSDGTLLTWGFNNWGQLGDGTTVDKHAPTAPVASDVPWIAAAAGVSHSAALKSDGTVWTWGYNYYGQLGDGSTVSYKPTPQNVVTSDAAANAVPWSSLESGDFHVTALKADGTLWAWGANWSGEVGDGTTIDRRSPIKVTTAQNSMPWLSASAGGYHTAAVKSDGTLWTWGYNLYGQLGYNPTQYPEYHSPKQVDQATDWIAVASGENHTVALKSNGTLWSWGDNHYGQLGYVTAPSSEQHSPLQIGQDNDWISVTAGESHTMAMKSDGTVWAWGLNNFGQLGLADGTMPTNRFAPTQTAISILPPFADFSGSPASGVAPLTVYFSDLSTNNPTSWLWDFGDGATSTLRNPTHSYGISGAYTVTLTATNGNGSGTNTKTNYISVLACPDVSLSSSGTTTYYATLQAAYDAAPSSGGVIKMRNSNYMQDLNANRPVTVALEGGKSCDHSITIGVTTLQGNIKTSAGFMTIKDFVLQK